MMIVDPALVDRFRDDLTRVLTRAVWPDERLALAVSGGPDSMAMLALAVAAFPGQVVAATVDHGLRADSAAEAAMVAAWCATHGIRHALLKPERPIGPSAVQARARQIRYALLARWASATAATVLLTAHHADDQAETFLMRAARGAGPAGLAGIRTRRTLTVRDARPGDPRGHAEPRIVIVRPLLDWRRADLRVVAVAAAVPFVDDPSNRDDHYERTRVRRLVEATDWLDPVKLARAAAHAGEADRALAAFTDWLRHSRRIEPVGPNHAEADRPDGSDDETWLDMGDLPRELQRRVARVAIADVRRAGGIVRPAFDEATNIEPLLDALAVGSAATQGGIMISRHGTVWRFRKAPPRRSH